MAQGKDLLLKIKADTSDAQKGISGTDSKLNSLSKTAKKVGAAMLAAFAASKIIDGIKSVSDAAQKSDKAMALVESTIKATGGAANLTAKEVFNLADEITKNTGVSDEAIKAGENMLLTFKNLKGEAFEKATKALVDMNTVMTNGNVTSESLTSQAIQLGKALNNPTEGMAALSRVGVQFTEKQKEQIKILQESGDIMGAQNIILNELESEFGGAAKAIGDTFGGQVMKTSESISTMKERLGKIVNILAMEFLPIIIKGADKIANFFNEDRVERWSNAIILAFKAVDLVLKPITLTIGKSLEGWGKIISLVTDYGNEVAKVDKKSAESITKQISLLKDKIEETLLSDALDATKKAGIQKYNDEIDLLYKDLKAIKANQKEKDKNHKTNIKYNADENISEEDKLKKQKEVSDKILKNFELNLAKKKADMEVSTQEEITQYEKLLENAQLTADARREIELKIAELGQKRREEDKDGYLKAQSEQIEAMTKHYDDLQSLGKKYGTNLKAGLADSVEAAVNGAGGITDQLQNSLNGVFGKSTSSFVSGLFGGIISGGMIDLITGIFGSKPQKTVAEYAEEKFDEMVKNTNKAIDDIGKQKTETQKSIALLEEIKAAGGKITPELQAGLGMSSTDIDTSIKELAQKQKGLIQKEQENYNQRINKAELESKVLKEYIDATKSMPPAGYTEEYAERLIPAEIALESIGVSKFTSLTKVEGMFQGLEQYLKEQQSQKKLQYIGTSSEMLDLSKYLPLSDVGFAKGGIVKGNSFSGDRLLAPVNSGEMVLNKNQQNTLFKILNNGASPQGQSVININGGIFMADRTQAKQLALMIDEELVKLKRQNLRVS